VVTAREAPPECAALTIDRKVSRADGAVALRRDGAHWQITAARPAGQDRPWARALPAADEAAPPTIRRPAPRDATPRPEDLEAGD
jgi:competence protein ComEC